MSKIPVLSGQRIIKALSKIGYQVIRQKGSHIRLDCPHSFRKRITVPNYKSIDKDLLTKILKNADLKLEEFVKLL